jgi:hypothetical protein
MTRWADVAAPWRAALELAWTAYAARTIPVGAVVADRSGCIVAEGRNAVYRPGDEAPLAGSRIAHAELAALGCLRSEEEHADKTLYATLEARPPSRPDLNAHVRRARTAFRGPLDVAPRGGHGGAPLPEAFETALAPPR